MDHLKIVCESGRGRDEVQQSTWLKSPHGQHFVSRRHFDSVWCVQELGGEGAVADPLPNPLISLKSDKPEDAPSSAKPPATAAGMGRQPFSHI